VLQLASFASDLLAPGLIVVGVVALGVILLTSLRGKLPRRPHTPSPREAIEAVRREVAEAEEFDDPAAELLDLARRLSAQLDTKAERLERLLDDARRIIESLEQHAHRQPAPPPAGTPEALDPFTRSVHELADEGLDPVEIARRLDEQTGKIELVLALRRTRV
jgi:hypothetical protein